MDNNYFSLVSCLFIYFFFKSHMFLQCRILKYLVHISSCRLLKSLFLKERKTNLGSFVFRFLLSIPLQRGVHLMLIVSRDVITKEKYYCSNFLEDLLRFFFCLVWSGGLAQGLTPPPLKMGLISPVSARECFI